MTATLPAMPMSAADDVLFRLDALARRRDVHHAGLTVRWRSWGKGPPLVLLHGGHGSWMHWVRNIEALAQDHTVWVPDMPGYGDSDAIASQTPVSAHYQQLQSALLATLDTVVGEDNVIDLAGFSFGGLVAAELAAQRGRVRRLALLGASGHGGTRRQKVELLDWRSDDRDHVLRCLRHNLGAFMLHSPAAIDALAMAVHEASCVKARFRSKSTSRAQGRLQGAIGRLDLALLLVWGEHDVTVMPFDIGLPLTEGHEERELHVLPGLGHWVQFEGADEVNRMLVAWFSVN